MTARNVEEQAPGPKGTEDPSDYARLLQFLYSCPVGLVEFAGDGTVIHLNPAVVRILTAIVGGALQCTNVFDMFGDLWPDMADRTSETDPASYMVVDDHRVTGTVQGVRCWWSLSVVRVAPDRYTLTVGDVTRSAEAEHALAQREAELQSVFASIDEGFCVCQMIVDETGKAIDYRFESVNPLFEQMTGLIDPVGRTALELIPDLEPQWVEAYAKVALLGETLRLEQGSDVMGRWFDVFATPIGTAGRFAIVFRDQTAKREADRALEQAARLNGFRAQLVDSLRNGSDAAMMQGRSAELLGELLDATRVHYAEFDATVVHGVVHAEFCRPGAASVVGSHRLDDFGPEVMDAVRAGLAVRIDDTITDARLDDSHRAATIALGIGAYAIVPVVRIGRPVAALTVHHDERHEWTNDELDLIDEVAQRTWAAGDEARAAALQGRRHERSDAIAQLLADLELESSLEAQAQRCCDVLATPAAGGSSGAFFDYATIEIPAAEKSLLAAAHVDPEMLDTLLTLRQAHRIDTKAANSVGRAATGEAKLLPRIDTASRSEYAKTPEVAELLDRLGPRSHMAVPLHLAGDTRGALMVGITRPERDLFSAADLDFLKTTAERIGVVLAATHLRRQEHAVSHRLQKALLPTALVENPHLQIAARYQPASTFMEVGGDWYDTFSWPSGHVGLLVGDVVGHDLESAAAMGFLRAGMAALAPNLEPSPAVLLDALQRCACAPGGTDFVTAACAIVDTTTGKLTYSSAGHPPMFLVSSNGHVEVLDQALSPPLGRLDITSRPETTISISPGATLIMYTDGLIERRRAHLDDGINGLREALTTGHHLPIESFTDHLITTMTTNSPTEDDIVVICARFTTKIQIESGVRRKFSFGRQARIWLAVRAVPRLPGQLRRARCGSWLVTMTMSSSREGSSGFAKWNPCAVSHPRNLSRLSVSTSSTPSATTVNPS